MSTRQRNVTVALAAVVLVVVGVVALVLRSNDDSSPGGRADVASAPVPSHSSSPDRCHTSELNGGLVILTNGAAGNDAFVVIVTNTTDHVCTVTGYPGIGWLSEDRQELQMPVERGSAMLTKDLGPTALLLEPGQSASASVGYTPNCNAPADGIRPAYVELTPPDEQDFLLVRVELPAGMTSFQICGSHVITTALVSGNSGSPNH